MLINFRMILVIISRYERSIDKCVFLLTDEEKRQPSPDSILGEKEKMKRKEDDYDSG